MSENKKTLVIGGSTNPERFSYKAIKKLVKYDFPVVSVGLRAGEVEGVTIETGKPDFKDIHTITLYVGKAHQPEYYEYFMHLKPQRIIFNPGTENAELRELAKNNGIETVEFCTLIMLGEGSY